MEHEVRVCDTCGDVGYEKDLFMCNKCSDGAEHNYCMPVKLDKDSTVEWTCQVCMPREGTNKLVEDKVEEPIKRTKGCLSESSINLESSKSSKLRFRSSYTGKNGTNGVSSTSCLSTKRHRVPLEAQSVKKANAIDKSVVCPRSFKPYNNSLLHKDFSCKKIEKVKMKSINKIVYSVPQNPSNSQEKTKPPHACGDILPTLHVSTLAELDKKGRALETSGEPLSKKLGKRTLEAAGNVTSLKQTSYNNKEKAKLPYCSGDESTKLDSETEVAHDKCFLLKSRSSKVANLKSKGQLTKDGCLQNHKDKRNPSFQDDKKEKYPKTASRSTKFNSIISGKSNDSCSNVLLADAYELCNPAMCLPRSRFCNLDVVESSIQLDSRLQASNHYTRKNPNCPNEMKKNESQQAKHPTEVFTPMTIYKLSSGPNSDERSHLSDFAEVEAAILSQGFVIPKPLYSWLGKFQIQSEGFTRTCGGIQAHLSTCASLKVLEVVDKLPDIIILDELPRLRVWPSQFIRTPTTEENIALYFFANDADSYRTYYKRLMDYMTKNDLALKGKLDGVELLIFPSNILHEKSRRWNQMFFFWGIFKERKVNNSANTRMSNSLKLENRDTVKSGAFDLNAYPQDGDDIARVDEIPDFDSIGCTRPSGDRILVVGDSSNGKGGEAKQECAVVDLNISLWPESETPENASFGVEDNVEVPSTSLSLAPPSTAIHEENLDPLDRQIADILILLSRDRF